MTLNELKGTLLKDLYVLAKDHGIKRLQRLKKKELILSIMEAEAKSQGRLFSGGILEILQEGYGFLRTQSYLLDHSDIYVSPSQIRKFQLRTGDTVIGHIRAPREGENYNALLRIEAVNFENPDALQARDHFENLTPIYPDDKYTLETDDGSLSCRVIDLITPIGKGQRGLIVAPPKAGKTTLIKEIANSIMENHPEVELMVLLIDERPEEVTDMERSIKGEVISSTFDKPIATHIQVTEMVIEKAKRYVELGKDVIILLDSLTRLARAYNIYVPSTGQTLTGGVNPQALYKPKKFFGSARNIEEGGSLTIIGTILVDTGSRMDEVIFEEFKGTGNMELCLDRNLFQKRIFPAVNVKKSSTRREDLLMDAEELEKLWTLRKIFANCTTEQAISLLLSRLKKAKNNAAFLKSINMDKFAEE
ncbi:MAG: transcription termination factor Rho [Candidatus Wallbacteria bacterium HGW-Wallbacteria-1]|uniref:Transcription termination factor Rho n=1 Tax=Candidatus Wallbacteria bacterium HGW-Wallbacteria-1 TaxID=2013854 RepID=A0A2N1PU04_9BACT|nr:MAG: transcription termination factor Rho [Candidatus Wallbacteria bacterium HGW-Wallbacteria-1]